MKHGQPSTDAQAAGKPLLARQPIFDPAGEVWGYELLFRSSDTNAYDHHDGDAATTALLDSSLNVLGLGGVAAGKRALINFTRELLVADMWRMLPRETAVIEVLETVAPDAEVIAACRRIRDAGYMLALDDVIDSPGIEPLIELADLIKVEFPAVKGPARRALTESLAIRGLKLLAEKVETPEDHDEATRLGYHYVQGYFFCRPQIVLGRDIPIRKRNYLALLRAVHEPEINLKQVEAVIRQDVGLTTRLLRYLNSASFGLRTKMTTVHQALVHLGTEPLRKWVSITAITSVSEGKPAELLTLSMTRARLCELVASASSGAAQPHDAFMVGMLSTLDALMDRPLDELLMQLSLPIDVKIALLKADTPLGRLLQLACACERGALDEALRRAEAMGVTPAVLSGAQAQALQWADEVTDAQAANQVARAA